MATKVYCMYAPFGRYIKVGQGMVIWGGIIVSLESVVHTKSGRYHHVVCLTPMLLMLGNVSCDCGMAGDLVERICDSKTNALIALPSLVRLQMWLCGQLRIRYSKKD